MRTAGELWQSGEDILNRHTDRDTALIQRVLNRCYFRLCTETDWDGLRRKTALTFAGTETTGLFLPSDLVGVTAVVCETDAGETTYYPTQEPRRYFTDGNFRWYHPEVEATPLDDLASGITVQYSASAFTGTLGGDRTGEYIRFASEPGLYRITSAANAFTPAYWGPQLQSKGCTVRPRSTKKLAIIGREGEADAATVQVFHWVLPGPLYRDQDEILLPDSRALELMMWIDLLGGAEKRRSEIQDWLRELRGPDGESGVLGKMIDMNPRFVSPQISRDRYGAIRYFGRR